MAILAALLAFGSRFAGKILTTALGWAATLLFGRVPADRQILVLGITFGSVIWVTLLLGVLFPEVGTFLLLLVPPQGFVPEGVIRLAMLAGALIVPGIVGSADAQAAGRVHGLGPGNRGGRAARLPGDRAPRGPAGVPRGSRDLAKGHESQGGAGPMLTCPSWSRRVRTTRSPRISTAP